MWWFKKKKRTPKRDKLYYLKIVIRSADVAQMWYTILQCSSDPAKVDRILRHLHRIRRVQAAAQAKASRL